MPDVLKIGTLELKHPVIQSPMCGCTDLPYRIIARQYGCELAFCEMTKDRAVLQGGRRTMELIATSPEDQPLGIQLAGREPKYLAEAARKLEDHGAAILDINLGCPVRKIIKEGCGAALIREPEQVGKMVDAMVRAVDVPVTIKMRTGFESEQDGDYIRVAKLAEKAGAAAVTIHGRTRLQRFSGVSNHDAIRRLKDAVSIPVIGNGNIYTGEDAVTMMKESGCDGVMVARGALGNPWIYREIAQYLETGTKPAPPPKSERVEVLREHFRLMMKFYGPPKAFLHIRRVIHWFVRDTPGAPQLRAQGNHVKSEEDFEAIADAFAMAPSLRAS